MSESSAHIVASLRELSWLLTLRNEDFFRSRAYGKAADAIVRYDGDLGTLIDDGKVASLPGVGKSTALIVGELHQTGRCRVLSDLRRDFPREVGRLARVPGLGLVRLQALHKALGIETVQDLRKAAASGALAGVKGFGPALIGRIQKSLDGVDDAPHRILLPHARTMADDLIERWSPLLGCDLVVTGAIRRREVAIDGIDLIGAHVRTTIDELPRVGTLKPVAPPVLTGTRGPTADGAMMRAYERLRDVRAWQGMLAEGLPVRLWLAPPAVFGAALVATTGPERFVQDILPRAEVLNDEAQCIKSAGFAVWPPEVRHAFSADTPSPDLVDRGQLQGLVHAHTTDSDGRDDLRTLAREAKALGYAYMTVTDHSPSARYAHGLDLNALAQQAAVIRDVEAEVGLRILRGTESDIHPDGGLDHPIEVLQDLDVVIASIHGQFRMDADAMTERLLKTFDLPVRVIWGHPLGRLVLTRAPIEADLDRILDRIADRGHIIEINGDPHRMDLPPEWIREARKRGIPLVLSADAHSARGLRMTDTAVDAARAGGVGASEVLNALDPDAFAAAVKP